MYPELRDWLEQRETNQLLTSLFSSISMVKGDKGDKGDVGNPGYTPIKGKDYFTDREVSLIAAHILTIATPKKGVHYVDGDDYVLTSNDKREIAGMIDVPVVEKVIEKTEIVKEVMPKSIDVSYIKGAVSQKDFESTAKKIENGMARVDGRIKLIDQRWHGGGLSQVSHDGTLSGTGTVSSPLSVIGGGFSGAQEKSLTTPDGTQQTFSFTHTPKLIFWGGGLQTLTDDYTVSSNSITFTGTLKPLTGDTILNVY